jgi:HSP20 family protein
MSKSRKRDATDSIRSHVIMSTEEMMDRLNIGSWIPNVDICETKEAVTIRIELPGIAASDIHLTVQGSELRVHGNKREPAKALERLSYYCLERRYGKFDRRVQISRVVDTTRANALLVNGVLTVDLPRIEDRRGTLFEIKISTGKP